MLVKLSSLKTSCKKKTLNFALKMLYMGIFTMNPCKTYCHIWNQQSEIFKKQYFLQNKKVSNLWPRMFYLLVFSREFEKAICQIWINSNGLAQM